MLEEIATRAISGEDAVTASVTLEIRSRPDSERPSAIAVRLCAQSAHLTGWRPERDGDPALAYFAFEREAALDRVFWPERSTFPASRSLRPEPTSPVPQREPDATYNAKPRRKR